MAAPTAVVLPGLEAPAPDTVMRLWLQGRAPTTLRAYEGDLDAFAAWLGAKQGLSLGRAEAIRQLLAQESAAAQACVYAWRVDMADAGLAPNTVNRRLAALRSLTKLARMLGVTHWVVEVSGARTRGVREVRGPSKVEISELLEAVAGSPTPTRDAALLAVLITLGLRRDEAAKLRVQDYAQRERTLLVHGKGGTVVRMTVPDVAATLLDSWVQLREPRRDDSRLFLLSGSGIYARIRKLGAVAGLAQLHPHGLRHSAVTAGLEATGGDVRKVKAFSRHAKVETVLRYDDAREDHAGQVAQAVSDHLLNKERKP